MKRPGTQAEQQTQLQEHSYGLLAGISKYFKSQIQSTKEGYQVVLIGLSLD